MAMKRWKRIAAGSIRGTESVIDRARRGWRRMRPMKGPLAIVPYLGFGTQARLQLSGRVLRERGFVPPSELHSGWRNLLEFGKRLVTPEVPYARLSVRFQGVEQQVLADAEGYFDIAIAPTAPLDPDAWPLVELQLLHPLPRGAPPAIAEAPVMVPPPTARFGVISDIDDTVLWSNVGRKLKMLALLARSNALTRKPFKGVAALYRALQRGAGGNEGNPIFYVSSSPWNLYTPLVDFLDVQGIPGGPLFLRDFGDHTLFESGDHGTHKRRCIERILDAFPHLQFVLIGDSGERDPEIYSEIVHAFPQRIRVVYIRSVNPDPSRIAAIDALIEQVRGTGGQLLLVPDSEFAAVHAAAEGLIASAELSGVRQEKALDS